MPTLWIPYCGAAPTPTEWLARWNADPWLLAALAALAVAAWRLRGVDGARPRAAAAALALAAVLFISPLCALSSALFSVRVGHHVLLTAAVAPLFVLALPRGSDRRIGASLFGWTAAHAAVFWVWHAPALYAAALSSDAVFWSMQASLFVTAAGFWHAVRRALPPAAAAALLATMLQMGLLGALLTLAASPLYAPHVATTLAWGYSPLEDQQLAGLIMWAPASALYLAAALVVVGRWLAGAPRPAPRAA